MVVYITKLSNTNFTLGVTLHYFPSSPPTTNYVIFILTTIEYTIDNKMGARQENFISPGHRAL